MKDIPYDKIDVLCRPMVKYFNEIGLQTKYCCQGHDSLNHRFYIMFDESVTDELLFSFLERFETPFHHNPFKGQFYKWARKLNSKIAVNWMYQIEFTDWEVNQRCAVNDLKFMKENF